jgi:hypothetical protein
MTRSDIWTNDSGSGTPTHVILVEPINGGDVTYGRCGIVLVGYDCPIDAARDRIQQFLYDTVEEFTPGAIGFSQARDLALEKGKELNLPVFSGGNFRTILLQDKNE